MSVLSDFDEPAAQLLCAMLAQGYFDLTFGQLATPQEVVFSLELFLPSEGATGIMVSYDHRLHPRDAQHGVYAYRFKLVKRLLGTAIRVTSADTHFERSWRVSTADIREEFPSMHEAIDTLNRTYTTERRSGAHRSPFDMPDDHLKGGVPCSGEFHHWLMNLYKKGRTLNDARLAT